MLINTIYKANSKRQNTAHPPILEVCWTSEKQLTMGLIMRLIMSEKQIKEIFFSFQIN